MKRDVFSGVGIRLFLGKGGVGKTTCAAATALHFAEAGERTLVPFHRPHADRCRTSSIRQRSEPGHEVVKHLFFTELGCGQEVRTMWDERFGREVYAVFSAFVDVEYDTFVEFMTSVLPGLNEEFMVDYVRRLALEGRYRRIVWDTAPLGQTLALLGTPSLLARHLRMAPRVTRTCGRPASDASR